MKYFSMFSGVEGFGQGIEKAYEDSKKDKSESSSDNSGESSQHSGRPLCIGFSESDKYASQVLRYHYPNVKNYGDCSKINWAEVPDFDLLTGGVPCQSWSIAGKRGGFDDPRGNMWWEFVRALKEKQPTWFIAENVKGLLSHDGGESFKKILRELSATGYALDWEVVNAKNFGVPQNRERVFIIGQRLDVVGEDVI